MIGDNEHRCIEDFVQLRRKVSQTLSCINSLLETNNRILEKQLRAIFGKNNFTFIRLVMMYARMRCRW